MRPELFRLFDFGFPSYFVLLVTGFMFAIASATAGARKQGLNPDVVVDLGIAMLIAGVIGGRILHVIADGYFWDYVHMCTDPSKVNWPLDPAECVSSTYNGRWDPVQKLCHPSGTDCFAWAKFWAGGLTYYGGFIGASGVAVWILRRDKFPLGTMADFSGFAIPMGLVFGRLGCLLAGCCFGAECNLPWALSFPSRSGASETQAKAHLIASKFLPSLHVHPTQVYESLACLAITGFCLLYVYPRKRYAGHVFVVFATLYAVARFLLEFLRRDDRGSLLGLSTSQLIGVAIVFVMAFLHKKLRPVAQQS